MCGGKNIGFCGWLVGNLRTFRVDAMEDAKGGCKGELCADGNGENLIKVSKSLRVWQCLWVDP